MMKERETGACMVVLFLPGEGAAVALSLSLSL
jgi:hypothetical protein